MKDAELGKLEISILLEEYKTLRDEILQTLESNRQILNLTLTAAGALIAGSAFFISSRMPTFFLVAPLVFYGLAWTQLRYIFLVYHVNDYLKTTVEPRIRQNLAELSPEGQRDVSQILGWSREKRGVLRRSRSLLILPIAGSNYGIPLLAAVVSVVAYVVFVVQNSWAVSTLDMVLIAVNVVAIAYSILGGVWAEFRQ
jgi:hypothetical protein